MINREIGFGSVVMIVLSWRLCSLIFSLILNNA